jgi:low affinity Fe/Cu permease
MKNRLLDQVHPTAKNGHRPSKKPRKKLGGFHLFARQSARYTGKPLTFGLAALIILIWLLFGPTFHYSDTWQLVINTGTTIVTFLMVFLIQNTQNRDSEAVQLKLDELIRATKTAHTILLDLEELSEEELDHLKQSYHKLAQEALKEMRAGKPDFGTPDMDRGIRFVARL